MGARPCHRPGRRGRAAGRHHPPPLTASLSSRAARWQGTRGMLAGELTICGITRPVSLQAEYPGHVAPRDGRLTASRPSPREAVGCRTRDPMPMGL